MDLLYSLEAGTSFASNMRISFALKVSEGFLSSSEELPTFLQPVSSRI